MLAYDQPFCEHRLGRCIQVQQHGLAAGIARGDFTAVEVTDAFLARIEALAQDRVEHRDETLTIVVVGRVAEQLHGAMEVVQHARPAAGIEDGNAGKGHVDRAE